MDLRQAIKNQGGLGRVADQLGATPQRVCNWIERGVPIEDCAEVERVLSGEVKRWHLRPDDWHRIWPELIGADGAPAVEREAA